MEGRPSFQVVVQKPQPADQPGRKALSVNEALKYTPLTTSILPPYDQIPLPTLSRTRENARLVSSAERASVSNIKCTPEVRKRLESLLKPESLAEIKFKTAPTTDITKSLPNLTPVARMVLEMTEIDYRYPSPTPEKTPSPVKMSLAKQELQPTSLPTPALSVSPEPGRFVIEIPKPDPAFRHNDYVPIPESPKRRKLNDNSLHAAAALRLRTQRELADAALMQFQGLLSEIFEAQDRLESDSSNQASIVDHQFFVTGDEDSESEPRLAPTVLSRLRNSMKQLIVNNRLRDVPSEDIRRLQQLCEHSIEAAQTINLQPSQVSNDEDRDMWKDRIVKAENGALSASAVAYTFLGNQQDENLQTMEIVRWMPNILVNIFENCLIPVIEARPDGAAAEIYDNALNAQTELKQLLEAGKKLLDQIATICVEVQGAADLVNTVEFLAARLIFVQNAFTEKTAALGLQNYERARKQAMSVLAKLYAAFPRERSAILDEILSSLDKLPSTSRSARQYKLGDGKSIQLISALFMQLVQTASLETSHNDSERKPRLLKGNKDGHGSSDEDDHLMEVDDDNDADLPTDKFSQLQRKADKLFNNSAKSAHEIVTYLVSKAAKVSKTGDSPYRNIFDLFVEDLVNVLSMTDWPSSELLLRLLAAKMTDFAKNEKAAASKNMALECLGTMGSAISTIRSSVKDLSSSLSKEAEHHNSPISKHLARLAEDQLLAGLCKEDIIGLSGPFSLACQQFGGTQTQNLRAMSAKSYFVAQYAQVVCQALRLDEHRIVGELSAESDRVVSSMLEKVLDASSGDSTSYRVEEVTSNEAQLAYLLSILNLGFCRRFPAIVKTLSSSFSSDQAQVRSRSLKSVVTMLETDSTLLDRDPTIADDVFRCASDDSAMVRDSALSLIAKFIISKPGLEEKGIKRLLECADDEKIGVRKRALGHLKDIYGQDSRPKLKAAIAQKYLQRTTDLEDSVSELARRTLTDIWVTTHLEMMSRDPESAKTQVAVQELTDHVVNTVSGTQNDMTALLRDFIRWSFRNTKSTSQLNKLCKSVVDVLFQSIINGTATHPSLTTLMALAEARPDSVAPQQLSNLRRYLSNVSSDEDLFMLKSVIGIFRFVLPRLSAAHNILLKDIQDDLMKAISKMGRRTELDEIMSCLRTIDGVLHNTFRLTKLTVSVLEKITNAQVKDDLRVKLLRIIGSIGKHIDLEGHAQLFKNDMKTFKGISVSGFIADTVYPFVKKGYSTAVRLVAFESLGSICQAWPGQFNKRDMRELFYDVLNGDAMESLESHEKLKMQVVELKMLHELYATRSTTKDSSDKEADDEEPVQDLKKLGGSTKARDEDSAIALITGEIFKRVLTIALNDQGEKALLAVQTLASISHQGMIHPKQCAAAFVALETSPDVDIQSTAQTAHQLLHQQHESIVEREYMHAVHETFTYRKTLFNDPSGASASGKAKLASCFAIVNTSGSKYVKKFLSSMVARLSTDYHKLDLGPAVPEHVLFSHFVTQNLAFFEYARIEELLHTILQLEIAFSKNGAEVVQAIETVLKIEAEDQTTQVVSDTSETPVQSLSTQYDPTELKRWASAACAATMIAEARSHLRRQYGITRDVKAAMQQNKQAKEVAKAPVKVHGITGERLWSNSKPILESLSSEEAMIARCKDFLALMAVDDEVRVEGEAEDGFDGATLGVDPEAWQVPARGKKRKSTAGSMGGTPKKPRGRPPLATGRRSASISSHDDPDADFEG